MTCTAYIVLHITRSLSKESNMGEEGRGLVHFVLLPYLLLKEHSEYSANTYAYATELVE